MKKISIMVPCYNEEENVVPLSEAIIDMFKNDLPNYEYDILFIDNASSDTTRVKLRALCENNPQIRAIFNAKNFGQFSSPDYGILQTNGDCTIPICADFQDPIELIPELVKKWEEGFNIVCAIKSHSKENKIMYFLRSVYYKMIKKMSSSEQIEHFTGFGLNEKFTKPSAFGTGIRIASTLFNPNAYGAYLILIIFPVIMLYIYEKNRNKKGVIT